MALQLTFQPAVGVARTVNPDEVGQMDGRNYGLIFDGEIRYTITGKDNPVDSFVLIQAADSDRAFATSITAQTLAAGYTVSDVNAVLMKDFNANGATEGNTLQCLQRCFLAAGCFWYDPASDG